MSQPPLPPLMLLRSFLTVGSGFILSIGCFIGISLALGHLFFPEFIESFELSVEQRKNIMANDPQQIISRKMFVGLVGMQMLVCFGIGWLTIKTAPFAKFAHAFFLAALIFISYFQIAVADPPPKKSMTVIYMLAFPAALLLGAKWSSSRQSAQQSAIVVDDQASDQGSD